jgi:hypothetical protein
MATANRDGMRHRQPSRWGRNLLLLALVVGVALAAWFWSGMRSTALARASYAAEAGCLCRYAAGREMASCTGDAGVKQGWVGLHDDGTRRSVTASVPLLAQQTAQWSTEGGCVLEPWRD